jgi:hypothetical protein
MYTWVVNPNNHDLFQTLLNMDFNMVEAPLALDGLLIQSMESQPLYDGLWQFTINVEGSKMDAVDRLKVWIAQFGILPTIIPIPDMGVMESYWLKRLITLIIYKKWQLKVEGFEILSEGWRPIIRLTRYQFPNFVKHLVLLYHPLKLEIQDLIGYRPVIDLYHRRVKIKVASSDLIQLYPNLPVDQWIHGIPCVLLNNPTIDENKARLDEFAYDDLSPVVTGIASMLNTTFKLDVEVNPDFLNQYGFRVMKGVFDTFVQHPYLSKDWLMANWEMEMPIILIGGSWVIADDIDEDRLIRAAISAYEELGYNQPTVQLMHDRLILGPLLGNDLPALTEQIEAYYKLVDEAPGAEPMSVF